MTTVIKQMLKGHIDKPTMTADRKNLILAVALFVLLVVCVFLPGCAASTSSAKFDPTAPAIGTHKVWLNENYMTYEDSQGFACGHIERINNGWVYRADILGSEYSLNSYWNSFSEAQTFVERRCKP